MTRTTKTPTPAHLADLDAFDRQVELALEHFDDPDYLGRHSPLAQPYYLGRTLAPFGGGEDAGDTPAVRGDTLRRLLHSCAAKLEAEEQKLLEISYFARSPSLENVRLASKLNVAERTFYRIRLKAIKSLARELHEAAVPALRPEAPVQQMLIGRDGLRTGMLAALAQRRSVYLTGPTGVGKSALATVVLQWWEQRGGAGGWYTLRSHISDHAVSLVFALAHRLRTLGAGHTWRQLVADRGVTDWERTFALLRFDLGSIEADTLLLCFDDMDVLQDDVADHVQIIHVLETLKNHCPMVFIGQRLLLAADEYVTLAGLDAADTAALLASQGVASSSGAFLNELLNHTRGRPALTLLYAALVRAGEEPNAGLEVLARSATFEALFRRLWRRLGAEERALLQQLAVFRMPAPRNAWAEQGEVVARLQQRGLVTSSADGAIQVEMHLRRVADDHVAADERPLLHMRAAEICETHGDFVAAVYHAVKGRQVARAVWLWFVHRDVEVERGRGPAALQILREIALTDLEHPQDRQALLIARAELYRLAGEVDLAAAELQTVGAGERSATTAYVQLLTGQIREMQGQAEQALAAFRAAIDIYMGLSQQREVFAHVQESFVLLYRMHDLKQAQRAAILARARADALLGDLEIMGGRYQAALTYLESARQSAEQVDDDLGVRSHIYSYLGALHGRLGMVDQALDYSEQAMMCDRQRGDVVGPLYDQLNRAAALYVAERYEESLSEAKEGLAAAEGLKNTYLVCGLAAGAAEALCGLQHWEEAEYYATLSLQQEEEFFRGPACVTLALVRHAQGRTGEAEALLEEALANAQQIGDRYMEASVWCARGQICAADAVLAEAAWRQALSIYEELGIAYEVARLGRRLDSTRAR